MKKNQEKTRPRIQFGTTQEIDSPYWAIAKYYQSLDAETTKSLILEAASVYWMPFAYQAFCPEDYLGIKAAARSSSFLLQWRIYELNRKYQVSELVSDTWHCLDYQGDETVRFVWGYRPNLTANSSLDFLLKYLIAEEIGLTLEKKILCSSLAYWGVQASSSLKEMSREQLNIVSADCVLSLREHNQMLSHEFGLNFNHQAVENFSEKAEVFSFSNNHRGQPEPNKPESNPDKGQLEIKQEKLLNRPELDDIGLKMFGADQF